MGAIVSIICSATFCLERALTWTCCALLLILIMFIIILLMIYGISVGYHYAQKELANYAMMTRISTTPGFRRSGEDGPVVRLLAVNRSEMETRGPNYDVYQTKKPDARIFLETSETPIIVLEKSATEPALSQNEKELARRLIGRFRRSRNNTSTTTMSKPSPFLRPLKVPNSILAST